VRVGGGERGVDRLQVALDLLLGEVGEEEVVGARGDRDERRPQRERTLELAVADLGGAQVAPTEVVELETEDIGHALCPRQRLDAGNGVHPVALRDRVAERSEAVAAHATHV
jgi:hypothetical protein